MKRLADTCRELGYLFSLHDQYRDYYLDAPSYDPQFAVHEEDEKTSAASLSRHPVRAAERRRHSGLGLLGRRGTGVLE